jgi:hypothetical protein
VSLGDAEWAQLVHNHDADYISVVTTPTTGNFPQLTAGGELINSTYDETSFATAAQGALADSALQSIAADSITMDMIVDIATDTFLGRVTAATGTVEVLTNAQAKTALDLTGTNSGDQTSIVGITGTKAQFDTAVTDGNFMYIGDAPTAHTHLLSAGATDVTATAAEVNLLDLAGLTAGWVLSADTATTASWKAPAGGGGGDVTKVGTPVNDQIGVWTGDGTIEGTTGFTFDSSVGSMLISSNSPQIRITDANSTANNRAWAMGANANEFSLQLWDDSYGVGATVWSVSRTANNINEVNFFAYDVIDLPNACGIYFQERADHAKTPLQARGELWLRNSVPNVLMFTDDAGTDFVLNTASGGDVTKVGTPVDNQVGVWTGDGTLEGTTTLTYSGTALTIGGAAPVLNIGQAADLSTGTASIEVGAARTGDGVSQIDLIGDTSWTDYGLRLIRNGGVNGTSQLTHRGTGTLSIITDEVAAIQFQTNNTAVLTLDASQNATFDGNVTVLGQFTSLGIDDNASGERLQLSDTLMLLGDGTSGEEYTVGMKGVINGSLILSGGTAGTNGGAVYLYGTSHATLPNDIEFRSNAVVVGDWDESDGEWTFKAGTTPAANLTLSGNAGAETATFAGVVKANNIQSPFLFMGA